MDRAHMQATFTAAHQHKGASFVEVYQNCNVFNDGAFNSITSKDARSSMLIDLKHGEPILFGADNERGVLQRADGSLEIVEVADVGLEKILVHDAHRPDPALAFSLSRLSSGVLEPTPVGVFRDIQRSDYGEQMTEQVLEAQEKKGTGDLAKLFRSASTWTVD